jgi:hypothetical protein
MRAHAAGGAFPPAAEGAAWEVGPLEVFTAPLTPPGKNPPFRTEFGFR